LSPSPQLPHTVVIKNIEAILTEQMQGAEVLRESGWYCRIEGLESVPSPDLTVVKSDDFERCLSEGKKWFEGKPLFVIEVISPSERKATRLRKVGLYLDAGAGAVIEVDLTKRILLVYWQGSDVPEMITAGHIERPFAADLNQIFARLR
jgi:Uma2 family endonuclease